MLLVDMAKNPAPGRTKWWGRTRSIFAPRAPGNEYDWISVDFPADQTPYTHAADHWHPLVDLWLPHPPVRGRRKK